MQGGTVAQALNNSRDLAAHAERWGYHRFWLAEHHNMPGIASSATSVAISHVAAGTNTIRVGAGGVMLPNHAPLVIAEQFGTLAALFPNRIDLGIGRAPGTDQVTAQALRRNLYSDVNAFPQDVVELRRYLGDVEVAGPVKAIPGQGTHVPLWILGSSTFGAQLAAALGLPYAFASHFAPASMEEAIELYRTQFQPSAQCSAPYLMLGFNICAAATTEEAEWLRSSSLQSVVQLRRGSPGPLPPPVENFDATLTPQDRYLLAQFTSCSAVGSVDVVEAQVDAFVERTQPDELMIVSQIFDHQARLRSFEIAADVMSELSERVVHS